MYITQATIHKVHLPLKEPFRISSGTLTTREIVFVKLFDRSGIVGIGESANLSLPIYEPEYNDGMILLLKEVLLPRLLRQEINSIEELETQFNAIRGHNFAKAAIEAAFWHMQMQQQSLPLRKLWGGVKEQIPAAISIGLGTDLNDSIARVLRYIETHQPQRAKIKIKPGIDVALIKAIRSVHPELPLMVDANSSYTLDNLEIFKQLDTYNLLMIEQPLQYNDLVDHSLLQKELKTKICLDESIVSYHTAEQALKIGACGIINIKPQRVRGYHQAKKIAQLAQTHNVPVWCGGMIESGWGQLFNCSIATLPNYTYDNDICLTKWYLADDILEEAIPEKDGVIDVSQTDKLFVINEPKFQKYTTLLEKVT